MEQQGFLRNVGNLTPQRLLRRVRNVLPVDKDAPLLNVGKTQQKFGERGLPRAAHAHQPHTLTCGNMQVETVEDLRAHATVRVEEVDVLKVDRAFAHHKL